MRKSIITVGLVAIIGTVAACDNDAERGLVGAAGGAVVSKAVGGDLLTGAVIGGVGGVFCDDVGVCPK
ncbi:hypothetical protein [uncultured Litoreibacter sp.]|uniref:hypothetical protein n=1 Tax=uncultured Litoreibacter sp. TaxID=1392394 RepID=UPI00262ACD41|nr:hypothetical protein [uncultured Litoreibacter sp.]